MTFACCDNLCPPDSFLQGFPFSASSTRGDSVITLQGSVQDPVRWNSSPKRNSFGKFPSIGGLALASVANEKSGSRAAQRPILLRPPDTHNSVRNANFNERSARN